MSLKIKPFEDPEAKPLISYTPWIKGELPTIVKDFPRVNEDSHRFAEGFNIVSQIYQLGFSDISASSYTCQRRPGSALDEKC